MANTLDLTTTKTAATPTLPSLDGTTPTAVKADTVSYDAPQSQTTKWNVTPDQTVQSRITGIIGENSDLLKQARTNATATANARGLVNSSMAVGAGEQAVINTALPIAQQDAATFANAGQFNAGQETQNSQYNAGLVNSQRAATAAAANQANQQQATAQNSFAGQTQAGQIDMAKSKFSADTQIVLAGMDAATRTQLADIQAQYQKEIASTQGASQAFSEAIKQIATLQNNADMTPEARTAAVNTQLTLLQNAMRVSSVAGTLGLDQILNFGDITGATGTAGASAGTSTTTSSTPTAVPEATQPTNLGDLPSAGGF